MSLDPNTNVFVESINDQIRLLQTNESKSADAIAMIPAEINDQLGEHIAKLIRNGVYFILCDKKLPNQFFFRKNLLPPTFVASDFTKGGALMGAKMVADSQFGREIRAFILLSGPHFSIPGSIRSREVLFALLENGIPKEDILKINLKSWVPRDAVHDFKMAIKDYFMSNSSTSGITSMYVFCGNDEICKLISTYIESEKKIQSLDWNLYGYDGIRDSITKTPILEDVLFARATVDQKPEELGEKIAEFLIDHYNAHKYYKRRRFVASPELIEFAHSKEFD